VLLLLLLMMMMSITKARCIVILPILLHIASIPSRRGWLDVYTWLLASRTSSPVSAQEQAEDCGENDEKCQE
jgi:hypothetical protein